MSARDGGVAAFNEAWPRRMGGQSEERGVRKVENWDGVGSILHTFNPTFQIVTKILRNLSFGLGAGSDAMSVTP